MKWQCPGCKLTCESEGSCSCCRLQLVFGGRSRLARAAVVAACAIAIMSVNFVYSHFDDRSSKSGLIRSSSSGRYAVRMPTPPEWEANDLDETLEGLGRSGAPGPARAVQNGARGSMHLDEGEARRVAEEIAYLAERFPGETDPEQWRLLVAERLIYEGCETSKASLEQAAASFGIEVEIKPDCSDADYLRGEAYRRLNKRDLAVLDLKRACETGYQEACKILRQEETQHSS